MKRFVMAILAAASILIMAALLLRAAWPTAAEPDQHSWPVAATVDTRNVEQVPDPSEIPAAPPPSAVPVEPVISFREPADELLTLKQTSTSDTSLRNVDFPRTYISSIRVDLTSPNHGVRLAWSGPEASSQEVGPFHSSPGRGLGNNNCDDVAESNRNGSNCTPKGTLQVRGFSDSMRTCSSCRFVTWFQSERGIAFHYYHDVPNYPASHGCVRLEDLHAAQLIHNNSKIGATEVTIDGKWTFVR